MGTRGSLSNEERRVSLFQEEKRVSLSNVETRVPIGGEHESIPIPRPGPTTRYTRDVGPKATVSLHLI